MAFKNIFGIATLVMSMSVAVLCKPTIVGYYPSWKAAQMADVDFSMYSHVNMAFGIPAADGSIAYDGLSTLQADADAIHQAGAKVLLSIGGWTGSNYFSRIMQNETSRANFLSSMVDLVSTYNLDGVDIDWEYPGSDKGNTCNDVDAANDTPNFLLFLQDLRKELTNEKLITMAVRVETFEINGAPSDVSEFAKVVDYAHLMQYDINGGWNAETGPNAPLEFESGKGAQVSFASAIEAWTSNGWPANQLTAGIAFYGRATTATEDMTKEPVTQYKSQSNVVPLGDKEDAPWADTCAGTGEVNSGFWQWKHLRDQGVLTSPDTAASPWIRNWDNTTQTPWLYNPDTMMFISYDDPESIQLKMDYAASKGLGGLMVWAMYMDTPDAELLTVLQSFSSNGSANGNVNAVLIAMPSVEPDSGS
ncbi:hypothetical protein LPJ75_004120, partial [Coemansia sp. RSA 2598]